MNDDAIQTFRSSPTEFELFDRVYRPNTLYCVVLVVIKDQRQIKLLDEL